jgi:hypothetical protein
LPMCAGPTVTSRLLVMSHLQDVCLMTSRPLIHQ